MSSLRPLMYLLLSCVLLAPLHASAAVLDGLYRIDQPQREGESRDEALRQATEVMLQRIAGEDVDLSRGPIAEALKSPRDLMRRIGGADGGRVDVEFEPAALRDLMASAQLPMLGRIRPAVIVWGVEAQTLGDELIGQAGTMGDALRAAAAYRGVALAFPLGDLEDRTLISETEIRSRDREALVKASERYAAEGTLALAVEQGEQTRIQWNFWLNDQEQSGRIAEADPAAAADALMRAVARAVFAQYAVPVVASDQLTTWQLVVQDINAVEDYASLQRLLQQLGAQSVPELLSVEGDRVRVQIAYPGDEEQLERMLSLGQRLVRMPAPEPEPVPAPQPIPVDAIGLDENGFLVEEAEMPEMVPPAQPEPDPFTLYYRWR
ncbi:DUF2066 domain-containing protein [Pseudomonas sp.]|uniref:DUF2066 domain-containing protein n=1 Tax=Pseudomonas sp. TaxID=306 RepID=UPI00272D4E3F|nr:DUF2066 domain-containing protein [Pseudomonas sp.]